jgi:hypothetical protein
MTASQIAQSLEDEADRLIHQANQLIHIAKLLRGSKP